MAVSMAGSSLRARCTAAPSASTNGAVIKILNTNTFPGTYSSNGFHDAYLIY
jgi:hypothetical protein